VLELDDAVTDAESLLQRLLLLRLLDKFWRSFIHSYSFIKNRNDRTHLHK